MKNFNFFEKLWEHSRTLRRVGLVLVMCLIVGIGNAWAEHGYNGESHVYLSVNGTTKYYKVSTESWALGSVSLPGTWGGVLSEQTFNKVLNIQVVGGAVGGWIDNDNISGTLYYKVTTNTTTPSSGWTSVGNVNANYTSKDGNNCFRYKNNYSVNVTPTTPGTYYLHIKITDGDSNNRTSYVKLVVPSFTVAGTTAVMGSNWDVTDTDNDMTFSSGTSYTLTKSNVTLATGTTYECKVVLNHDWDEGSYPASNKEFTVGTTGHYDVTFTFNASTQAVSVSPTLRYALTYNGNGSSSGSVPAEAYYLSGTNVTVAGNTGGLVKTGYTFVGWNTASNGSGKFYPKGSKITTTGSNTTLYAMWLQAHSPAGIGNTYYGEALTQVSSDYYEVYRNAVSSGTIYLNAGTSSAPATSGTRVLMSFAGGSSSKDSTYTWSTWMAHTPTYSNSSSSSTASGEFPGSHSVCYPNYRQGQGFILVVTGYDQFSLYGKDADTKDDKQYHVYINDVDASPASGTSPSTSLGIRRYTLTPGIVSVIRVVAHTQTNGMQEQGFSLRLPGCTSVSAPTGLTCSAQTKNSLTFSWTAASNASSYDVYLYSDAGCTSAVTPTEGKPYNVTGTSATLSGLTAGTTYYCKVQSKGDGSTYCESGGTTSAQSGTTKTVHTISFDINGGTSGTMTDITGIEYGSSQTLTANTYSRSGWTFTGWNTDQYGGGTAYADQATVASVTANMTLYAQWEKTVYLKMGDGWDAASAWFAIYYFDSSDGTKNGWVAMSLAESCSSPAVYTATIPGNGYNTMIYVRKNPASATLATWDNKWNQTVDLAYSNLTSNNQYTITDIDGGGGDPAKSIGSWGTYSAPTYTISYATGTPPTGSATISGSKSDQTKNCGVDFTLPNVVFTLAGYTQDGWATSNGGPKAYNLGGSYTTEASQTFYPHWSANQYSVSHSLTSASASSGATGSNAATCGTNYTAVFAAADGYTLPASITVTIGGNSTTAGTEYTWTKASGTVTVNGAYITGNVAITVAGIIKKTVTYKKNGGASGADGSVTGTTTDASSPYAHGSTVTTLANGFTNTGYKFKWWNTAYDGSGEDFYVGEKFDITANTNLFAQWEEIGTGEEFWVGDNFTFSSNIMSVGDMRIKEYNVDKNQDITKDYNQVSKYSSTAKKAKVLAMDAANEYLEIYFSDGSTINELNLGTVHNDASGTKKVVVIYSTTADFTSGVSEQIEVSIPTCNQSSKSVTDFSPSTEDLYKYARIYVSVSSAVYSYTGPASGGASKMRIYSIKAKKGAACESLDAPEGLSCTAQTRNSLTFGWSAVTNASSYDVYLYSDEDCTAEVTPTEGKPYNVTGTSATLTGLDGGTTYYCKVRTKGNGSTYCTNGAITTTAASGKTSYVVTYNGNSATSGSVPTDDGNYASGDEVTVKDNTGSLVKTGYTFRGWTSGDYFYQAGDKFNMPAANVTLTAVWDIKSAGATTLFSLEVKASGDAITVARQGGTLSLTTANYLSELTGGTAELINGNTGSGSAETLIATESSSYQITFRNDNHTLHVTLSSPLAAGDTIKFTSNKTQNLYLTTRNTRSTDTATVTKYYVVPAGSKFVGKSDIYTWRNSGTTCIKTFKVIRPGAGSGSWTNKYVAFDKKTGVVGTPTLPDTIWGVPSGKKVLEPTDNPVAAGYYFDGWYADAACSSAFSFTTPGTIIKDTTVFAKFAEPRIIMEKGGKGLISSMPGYDTLIINQSFDTDPADDYNISYTVGYSVSHTQLAPQPTIKYGTGAGVGHDTILMPVKDGANMYEVVAYLRTGTTRGAGDLVTTDTIRADVETSYAVKVRARVDGIDIAEERLALLYPSFGAISVTIWKEINGYELDSIDLGVGVTAKDTTERPDCYWIRYYAANASTITAVYKPKATTVYLFNTNTSCMYAATRTKLYDYGTGGYWHTSGETQKGAGSYGMTGDTVIATDFDSPVWMASIGGSTTSFAFTSDKLNGVEEFYSYTASNGTKLPAHVIYRTDYNATLPMFVPVAKDKDDCYIINKNGDDGQAQYYRGFWVKRSPDLDSTGYYLKVYNKKKRSDEPYANEKDPELIQSVPLRLTQTGEDGTWELTATIDLEANKTYGFKFTKATGASTVVWYADTNEGTMTSAAHTGWDNFVTTAGKSNTGITTTAAGDYTFHIYCKDYGTKAANAATATEVQGKFAVTVDYAAESGDYRVIYSDATQTEVIASPSIRPRANGQDTVSFFIRKNSASRVMTIQKFTSSWDDVSTVDLSTIAKDSVYVIYLQQDEDMTTIEATGIDFYSGDYYIRTDCVDEYKWDYKKSLENHRMIPTDYGMTAKQPDKFSHYYVHWVTENKNVKFIVANKYAPCLSDTVITDDWVTDGGGNLGAKGANIRFMYNKGTNVAMRAYLYGSQENDDDYLKLTKTSGSMTDRSSAISEITFTDMGNFTYQAEIAAQPGLRGKLTAEYLDVNQYFLGSSSSDEELISGSGDDYQNILLTYDFKTNRLICAWQPSGATITENLDLNADIMIIRKAQGDAQQIRFASDKKIEDVHYIYGVIEFEYDDMYHMMYSWDWWSYAQCMYYISFPFDVLVNDIMGVGALGQDWRLQRYNGAKRAAEGWFKDGTQTFWEDIHAGDTLHAYEGYSLLLNRSRFNGTKGNIWDNKHAGDKVYLYFPSVSPMVGELSDQDVTVHVPSHQCTINRTFEPSSGMIVNHKITDSHWNMIGTPMFADTTAVSMDAGPTPEGESEALQYVYAWNHYGNTLGIQLTLDNKWKFKTMYSYMAQYCGNIVFKGPAVNKAVAAKRAEPKKNYHLNLEISKDEQFIGRTYVELRENAVDTFLLNEDVYMVRNGVNADLFTYAGTYEAGANVLPIANQTVQVGVAVKAAGTYVFSMPDAFDGEVILVDTYTQTRTNLAIEDYEVALTKGDIINRFYLEININNVPTAIDGVGDGEGTLKDGKAHKFIMNDQMYILQNGIIYDARGARVK